VASVLRQVGEMASGLGRAVGLDLDNMEADWVNGECVDMQRSTALQYRERDSRLT
jgi:hypothetical protein